MIKLNIEVSGQKKIRQILGRLKDVHKDHQLFTEIGQYLVNFYSNDVFDTEGAVYGQSWEPLSERYRLWKARKFPGRGILERTGRMRKSFGYSAFLDIVRISNADKEKFRKHQLGEGRMPARVMMTLDNARVNAIIGIARKRLTQKIMDL